MSKETMEKFNTLTESGLFSKTFANSSINNFEVNDCTLVHSVRKPDQCLFVTKTEHCRDSIRQIDYLSYIYCVGNSENDTWNYLILLSLCVWCAYLFAILGTVADKFFCPALTVISQVMGLSEYLAGVTLLAFGNGSPDIFTAIASRGGDTELMYSELIGAAAFVICIIGGIIILLCQLKIDVYTFIRECLFFIFSVLFINYAIKDNAYTLTEAILTISIYIVYLIVVVTDHCLIKLKLKEIQSEHSIFTNENLLTVPIYNKVSLTSLSHAEIVLSRRASFTGSTSNCYIFHQFLKSINPIDNWDKSGICRKIFIAVKAPGVLCLLFIIPIVDYAETNHGWTKLLNILNLVTLPQLALFATGKYLQSWYYVPFPIIIFGFSIILGVIVFFTSKTDCAPKYHLIFAIISFVGSILIIYMVAQEVVSLFEVIGIVSRLSQSMLGLSVLAWGNSIGDLIANVALVRQGYHKMVLAACFGGPMFNLLIGVGLTLLIRIINEKSTWTFAREGVMGQYCFLFLFIIIIFILISFCVTKFSTEKFIGIVMISAYCSFIFICFLVEFEIL